MKLDVDDARYKELLDKEETLQALEAGGVDNWDGYDFSMEELTKKREIDSNLSRHIGEFIEEIAEVVCQDIEEPAGTGCGYGIRQEGLDQITKNLVVFLLEYDNIVRNR